MRRLLLFRHAKAESSETGREDRTRGLIERGRRDAVRIGAYMETHSLMPNRVIVSPAKRAQETWKHAADRLKPSQDATTVEKLYNAPAQTLFDLIKNTPATARTVLVVGHNPGLHEVALMLVASGDIDARERLCEKLPTSGLVVIDFAFDDWSQLHPRSGRLERFVSPKSLTDTTG
jgi:phosphohistidine phosphatase